jgi:hypothetical protein
LGPHDGKVVIPARSPTSSAPFGALDRESSIGSFRASDSCSKTAPLNLSFA